MGRDQTGIHFFKFSGIRDGTIPGLRGVVIRPITFRSDWFYFMNFRVIGLIDRDCVWDFARIFKLNIFFEVKLF